MTSLERWLTLKTQHIGGHQSKEPGVRSWDTEKEDKEEVLKEDIRRKDGTQRK